jgi:glycosyltransferase involved in cell wall biosynthesis
VDGIPEMVEESVTGFLVESEDAEGFARAVKQLLEDRNLRLRMGAAGRERARKLFSPETYEAAMVALYREIGGEA